jgi:ribonucleoside-diphosphate reductase alpha chain
MQTNSNNVIPISDNIYYPNDLSKFVFYRTYSRWLEEKKRRETYPESVQRVVDFYKDVCGEKLTDFDYDFIQNKMLSMGSMPSMRLMWTAGLAAKRNNLCTYNCAFVDVDNLSVFAEIFFVLLQGTGIGFSVEQKHIDKLPKVKKAKNETKTVVVGDSKEGWALALNDVVQHLWDGYEVEWDVSQVRPAGARLKTFGGRASGPAPLIDCFQYVKEVVTRHRERKLSPLNAHDLICTILNIVVVGGVRRAAGISLSDLYNEGMKGAKSGQFWITAPQRSMSNNSAVYNEKPTSVEFMKEWLNLAQSGTGERGIFNKSNLKSMVPKRRNWRKISGVNPCGEIFLRSRQLCNLTEVVVRADDTLQNLMKKVKAATIMGTIQASLTDFGFLNELNKSWEENCREEALLGVSLTGQMDNPELLTPDNLQQLEDYAIGVNVEYAQKLGINRSASITTTKPSGTVSILVDSSAGVHPRYAEYYIRRVRIASTDPLFHLMRDQGVKFRPEVGQSETTATTWVCEFPVKSPKGAITRHDVNAIEQLEHWKKIKQNWTEHTVSCTVYVDENEWLEVGNWVYSNFDDVSGISFLPKSNHIYQLAPLEEIDEKTFTEMKSKEISIDYNELAKYEAEDMTSGSRELACSGGTCELVV